MMLLTPRPVQLTRSSLSIYRPVLQEDLELRISPRFWSCVSKMNYRWTYRRSETPTLFLFRYKLVCMIKIKKQSLHRTAAMRDWHLILIAPPSSPLLAPPSPRRFATSSRTACFHVLYCTVPTAQHRMSRLFLRPWNP